MLSKWEEPPIQAIMKLMETQSKETIIRWALTYAENYMLPVWNHYFSEDKRPLAALNAAKSWQRGEIKLPEAKKAILSCYSAARDIENNPTAQAIARAIGQAASSIHVARHAIGLFFYGCLGIAYHKYGLDLPFEQIEQYAFEECYVLEQELKTIAVSNELNPVKIDWFC